MVFSQLIGGHNQWSHRVPGSLGRVNLFNYSTTLRPVPVRYVGQGLRRLE
jgi:hypothetical protein